MKTLKLTLGMILISILFAFNAKITGETGMVGVYGEKGMFEIILKKDNSFTYNEQVNNKNIFSKGKWEFVNDELVLYADTTSKIKSKWILANDGSCLQTKKRRTTYTLCKVCDE